MKKETSTPNNLTAEKAIIEHFNAEKTSRTLVLITLTLLRRIQNYYINMNNNLNKSRRAKNDEFYTQYLDIEKECQHYIEQFKDQWIYLPCDSEESNFWKYFIDHFNEYGLKRLTATHIKLDGTPSYRLDYDGSEVIKTALKGNGDFRSEECTKIKDECDMVITNPPFSLFREFIKWLQ